MKVSEDAEKLKKLLCSIQFDYFRPLTPETYKSKKILRVEK